MARQGIPRGIVAAPDSEATQPLPPRIVVISARIVCSWGGGPVGRHRRGWCDASHNSAEPTMWIRGVA